MIYIGVDNGLKGGIAIIQGDNLWLHIMPVVSDGKKNRVDVLALRSLIGQYAPRERGYTTMVVYERPVGSKNLNAAVSMQDSFARIESVLMLDAFRRDPITPQKWQKMFWKKPKMPKGVKFDTKAAALKVARQLWPTETWLASDRCRVPHDGLVDSALLSEYCRRTYG